MTALLLNDESLSLVPEFDTADVVDPPSLPDLIAGVKAEIEAKNDTPVQVFPVVEPQVKPNRLELTMEEITGLFFGLDSEDKDYNKKATPIRGLIACMVNTGAAVVVSTVRTTPGAGRPAKVYSLPLDFEARLAALFA
jgi:hypothetical protein